MKKRLENNKIIGMGLYQVVKKGLKKCDDPNDTPIFTREQYLEIKDMLDNADITSDEI